MGNAIRTSENTPSYATANMGSVLQCENGRKVRGKLRGASGGKSQRINVFE